MDICGKINLMDDNIGIDIPLFLKFKDFILEINDGNIDTPRIISQKCVMNGIKLNDMFSDLSP
jgi:hypothetical protein